MKNPLKVVLTIIVVIAGVLTYFWPMVQMQLAGSAHYTEQDKNEYEYYTPDLLKKMPRISERYEFDFYNVAGPGSLVYSVTFYNTKDTGRVSTYLTSLGYMKQGTCSVEGDCWSGKDPTETVIVSAVPKINAVMVQVDNSPQF
ncbi:hypothetical protein Z042_10915 [Chania multitudinisentens RB-25]|uniref:Uncharacterized protein n=1 Tax=Chania multitudinisentens RB-25 TaxID=1441930 RepID=W0LCS9_9GAMM|nr:hypothetical protein [Chania multitudinisentens]AHG20082.1 hypothetical protein Z042_10915 [Chania multitudinisentens RB-25]